MKKIMKKRSEKLLDGFMFSGFDYNGIHYKPLTAQSLLVLQRVNSPIYTGIDTDKLWLQTVLEYMYVTSKPIKDILKAQKNWDEAILEYADGFSHKDLVEIGKIITEVLEMTAAAVVEVREDDDEGEKK